MEHAAPAMALAECPPIHDPDGGEAGGHQQARPTRGVCQRRCGEMEAPTLLVRKKGLDPEPLGLPATGLSCRGEIREQLEWLLRACGPAAEEHHRALGGCRHPPLRERAQRFRLAPGRPGRAAAALPVPPPGAVPPRADPVGPPILLPGVLARGASKRAIAPPHHRRPQGDQGVPLRDERDRQVCGTVPLLALTYLPGPRQSPALIDARDHQGHPATSHDAPVPDEDHGVQGQRGQPPRRLRHNIALRGDPGVTHPPGPAFETALCLGAVGNWRRALGQVRPLAPNDAAEPRRAGR